MYAAGLLGGGLMDQGRDIWMGEVVRVLLKQVIYLDTLNNYLAFQRDFSQKNNSPPSANSIISAITKLPPISLPIVPPQSLTNLINPRLAAFLTSSSLTLISFLLVRPLISSVSAIVAICAGVKCR